MQSEYDDLEPQLLSSKIPDDNSGHVLEAEYEEIL